MRREVRANLIFIVCLVLLITPGFIFLMKKKLNGSTRPNFMPEAAPYQIAYIQPLPAPPVPRKEPNEVREWVRRLLRERLGGQATGFVDQPGASPVSDRFVTQLVAFTKSGDGTGRVVLLRWDATNLVTAGRPKPLIGVDMTDGATDGGIETVEPIDVPRDVRHALQDVGYVDPPQRVFWIEAKLTNLATGALKAVRLTTDTDRAGTVQELIFVANPATRPSIEVTP